MDWLIEHAKLVWFGLGFSAVVIFIIGLLNTYRDAEYPGLEDLEL